MCILLSTGTRWKATTPSPGSSLDNIELTGTNSTSVCHSRTRILSLLICEVPLMQSNDCSCSNKRKSINLIRFPEKCHICMDDSIRNYAWINIEGEYTRKQWLISSMLGCSTGLLELALALWNSLAGFLFLFFMACALTTRPPAGFWQDI